MSECSFADCRKSVSARGLCSGHYRQARQGQPLRPLRQQAPAGTGHLRKSGYRIVYAPSHPNAQANGYLFEHVVVMAQTLGRPLATGERVHHVNGQRADNRPENLELWQTSQPSGQRTADRVEWMVSELRRLAPERLA